MAHLEPDLEDKPLDPDVERVRRKIVRFVAINLGILLLALMAVGVALVYKWNRPVAAEPPAAITAPGEPVEAAVPLPFGTRILSQSLSGARISLDTIRPDGRREIVIYDYATAQIVARLAVPTTP